MEEKNYLSFSGKFPDHNKFFTVIEIEKFGLFKVDMFSFEVIESKLAN